MKLKFAEHAAPWRFRAGASKGEVAAPNFFVLLLQKENPKQRARLGFLVALLIKQLAPNRLSGVGGWGLGYRPSCRPCLCAKPNALSTWKLPAAKRSFGGIVGELNLREISEKQPDYFQPL